jgi:DNA-binding NtrC family response regulator
MISNNSSKVLVVDDNEDVLLAARLLLKPYAKIIHTEKNPAILPELLREEEYDVIFLDMNFTTDITSGQEGFYWLDKILSLDHDAVVILITAYGDIETAVKAVKEGATDFILKPWQNEKFLATYSAAIELRKSKKELENLRYRQKYFNEDTEHRFHDLIGKSPAIQDVFTTITKVAGTDVNVLILGENGTGKELVARAIHKQSKRSDEVFISVDIGAISQTLFESELFGHTKGAFTNANENRAGRFEIASGGTLFLDEIANIPFELQAKLLSVIQNREVSRLGSNQYRPVDIRLISATNKPIDELVFEKKFRDDLLFRINTVEIKIPPLREREDDIPLLADYFLSRFKSKYKKEELNFSDQTLKRFKSYPWPGNVRELQHAIERSVILSENDLILPSDIFFREIKEQEHSEDTAPDNMKLEDAAKTMIRKAISKYEGNITKAAKELGLTRASLYRRMEKYGL